MLSRRHELSRVVDILTVCELVSRAGRIPSDILFPSYLSAAVLRRGEFNSHSQPDATRRPDRETYNCHNFLYNDSINKT